MKALTWTNSDGSLARVTCSSDVHSLLEIVCHGARLENEVYLKEGCFVSSSAAIGANCVIGAHARIDGTVDRGAHVPHGVFVPRGARYRVSDCALAGCGTYHLWSSMPGFFQYGCESGPISRFNTREKRLKMVRQHGGARRGAPHGLSEKGQLLYADLTRAYLAAKTFHDLTARPPKPAARKTAAKSRRVPAKKKR